MQAIVFDEKSTVSVREIPDPVPGSDEVLVRVGASGICHTDLEILKGNYGNVSFPVIPGHEYAGEVVALGKDVRQFSVGDRVVVDPNIGCGNCLACQRNRTNLCTSLGAYGVSTNGGFAELSVLSTKNLVTCPDISLAAAALAEPLGCVLNGIHAINLAGAANALVVGAGPIGLLMAIALSKQGVASVTLADIDTQRLEKAICFGFAVVEAGSTHHEQLKGAMDAVVDTTGVATVVQDSIEYLRDGGQFLCFGVCPAGARIEISPYDLFRRQLTLAGSHSLNSEITEALDIITDYGPGIENVISHRYSLGDVAEVLAAGGLKGSLKVQAIMG